MSTRVNIPSPKEAKAPAGVPHLLSSIGDFLKTSRQAWEDREQTHAPRFRSFSFFSPREEAVSRMIAALLDPEGLHGQGRAFLDLFIGRIGSEKLKGLRDHKIRVRSVNVEDRTKARRRIDIVVCFDDGFNLAIENKVFGAAEQEQQLKDYARELASRGKFLLLFLQPETGDSTSLSEQDQAKLTEEGSLVLKRAKEFILSWLEECSKPEVCKATNVRDFLLHFTHYIKHPPEETFMTSKDIRTPVIEQILQSSQALESAIAIRENFESAVHDILNDFLNTLYTKLEDRSKKISAKKLHYSMNRYSTFWTPKKLKPVDTLHPQPFNESFGIEIWKYVGFTIGNVVAIDLETGFADPVTRQHFGVTIGVHNIGPYKLVDSKWAKTGKLKASEEANLRTKLDGLQPQDSGLLYTDGYKYEGWLWHRYINTSFNLYDWTTSSMRNDGVMKFYYAVHDEKDPTLNDIADFMVRLGEEVGPFVPK